MESLSRSPLPAPPAAPVRLLLVEDDQVDRLAFQRFVQRENLAYEVAVAVSLAEARRQVADAAFDVVLLDCQLGDGSGFELLEALGEATVIFVTGADSPETAVRAMKQGASDYLLKDHDRHYLKLLPLAVARALHRRQEEQERRQLQALLDQARKLESLGTLAGGVAHEFNNILAIILSYTELAKLDAQHSPPVLAHLGEIHRASLRARDVVAQILAFSRGAKTPRQAVQLDETLQEALAMLHPQVPPGTAMSADGFTGLPPLEANRDQVREVLVNVGRNAVEALRGAPGQIQFRAATVTLPAPALPLVRLAPGSYAQVLVTDNGAGMDAATVARVFDPFFSTKAPGHGAGLGLSVVHGIMQAHGGAVLVESTPGQGTRVQLYFPLAAGKETPARKLSPRPETGLRILLLDDEPSLVKVCTKLLERMGHSVQPHHTAATVLASLQQGAEPDLLMTDYNMPGMNGLQVAEAVWRVRPRLPIILTTGYGEENLSRQALRMGVSCTLQKPVSSEDLARALSRAVSADKG